MNLYTIEVSGPLRTRYMRVRAESLRVARIVASRKIWPARGEYIRSVQEVSANVVEIREQIV